MRTDQPRLVHYGTHNHHRHHHHHHQQIRCVFELATFLRNRRSRPIQLLPVEMSMLAFLIGLCYSMVNLAYRTIMEARNMTFAGSLKTTPWLATLRASGWLALIGVPVIPFYIYLGLDFMMKLRLLPTQLRTFDARKASCYCCTVPRTFFRLEVSSPPVE